MHIFISLALIPLIPLTFAWLKKNNRQMPIKAKNIIYQIFAYLCLQFRKNNLGAA